MNKGLDKVKLVFTGAHGVMINHLIEESWTGVGSDKVAASEDRFHYAPRKGIGKLRELNKHGPVKRFHKISIFWRNI